MGDRTRMFNAFLALGCNMLPFAVFILVFWLHIKVFKVNHVEHPKIV